jgi:glycosyltransferase involved in cell wall biosynthesis
MLGLNKNVKISGWVKDIKESYCQGKVFVAPLFIGTGLQNKLLEAMALGVPCITTSLANKALKATHNENVLIANEPEEFYQNFQSLNTDSLFLEKVRKKAKSFVVNKYSWQKSVEKIEFNKN